MNISRTHMGCLERGERSPSLETLIDLCCVLDVSADWLLGIVNMPTDSELADCTPEETSILTRNLRDLKSILGKFHITNK